MKKQKSDDLVAVIYAGGPKLASLIDNRFKTRASFCLASGLQPYEVSRICNGARPPTNAQVLLIAAVFGVEIPHRVVSSSVVAGAAARWQRIAESMSVELAKERDLTAELKLRLQAAERMNDMLRKRMAKIFELVNKVADGRK